MINRGMKFIKGNIFDSDVEALVNTVNTVGIMGKGIALQFKERFPENYKLYAQACAINEVQIGKMLITPTNRMINPKWIINFPTKRHWRYKSNYNYIEEGLDDLEKQLSVLEIKSIAIPPLGAGHGDLQWRKVRALIISKMSHLNIDILIYEPNDILDYQVIGKKANLTSSRALILSLIHQYSQLGYEISILEIQKLAYFLQCMGQNDLKLKYKKHYYGPYAHNLQHLLHELEKGFISTKKTVMDAKPLDIISLNPEIIDEVEEYIKNECTSEEKDRLKKVEQAMAGFESPFGLELLSSVDWILRENGEKP